MSKSDKNRLMKMLALEAAPFISGAGLAAIGRSAGEDWIPIIPIGVDLMYNGEGYGTPEGLLSTVKYGLGVATVYADKIIPVVNQYLL